MKSISHFKSAMMTVFIALTVVEASFCPKQCLCKTYQHKYNGLTKRMECKKGGMDELPVAGIERDIHELIIAPQPKNLNSLTIGPILTQPEPFVNLRELTIINSQIPSIGQYSFWGLQNLKDLNLSHNNLTSISIDNFRGLLKLVSLTLDFNVIRSLASETFRHLESLKRLSLSHNEITTLVPRQFRMLVNLESLDLSFNPIYHLNPEIFKDIQRLKYLKCRQCYLSRINAQIYHLSPLIQELDLGENLFKFFTDDDFLNLKVLKVLKLDRNQLSVVVDDVFQDNVELRYLEMACNRIVLLAPGALNNLSHLKTLNVSYNRLEKLLPATFTAVAESLLSIDISGNKLQLDDVSGTLQTLPRLQDIRLNNLSLKSIPPNTFAYNRELMSLDLGSNQLTEYPHKLLINTRYLQYLDISRNQITFLKEDHLRRLEGIAKIDLSSNKWDCDQCSMETVLKYMNTSVLKSTLRDLRCDSPLRLRGMNFADLNKLILKPCFSSHKTRQSIVTGVTMVLGSVVTTVVIALYLTRRPAEPRHNTDEAKRRDRSHERLEEVSASTANGGVSTIRTPLNSTQNSS